MSRRKQALDPVMSKYGQLASTKSTEAVFRKQHGVWDPMLELTITHLISYRSQLRSQLSTPTTVQRERRLYFWLSTFVFVC